MNRSLMSFVQGWGVVFLPRLDPIISFRRFAFWRGGWGHFRRSALQIDCRAQRFALQSVGDDFSLDVMDFVGSSVFKGIW
jgi:hypothetical protein